MKGTGFCPIHCDLWRCCEQQDIQAAQTKKGAFYFHMAEMLFAYLAYEAYLNFVGSFLFPNEWKQERRFLRIDEKLKLIEEKIGFQIDKNTDPYRTVANLKELRDFISHGKPDNYPITSAAVKRDEYFPFSGKFDQGGGNWVGIGGELGTVLKELGTVLNRDLC